MALQMYVKFDGVVGEAESYRHKGWSEFLSWQWEMNSNRREARSTDQERTTMNSIRLTKEIGIDSAALRDLFARGTVVPAVELSITPVMERRQLQAGYVALRLEQVRVLDITTGGDLDSYPFKETMTLLFERIQFVFDAKTRPRAGDAGKEEAQRQFTFGWDITGNTTWEPVSP